LISYHVRNYDAWLKAFDAEGPAVRAENGIIDRGIARDYYDPNLVYILSDVSDMAKSKARVASPESKKILSDAGVETPPTSRWFKVVK
jgi:quinol monooxygenase YgiN